MEVQIEIHIDENHEIALTQMLSNKASNKSRTQDK
jgi:hypothetical protein